MYSLLLKDLSFNFYLSIQFSIIFDTVCEVSFLMLYKFGWGAEIRPRGYKKVQVGKDQEKAQPEKDSHSKNRGGKKPN